VSLMDRIRAQFGEDAVKMIDDLVVGVTP
jgi:hypothetical protein